MQGDDSARDGRFASPLAVAIGVFATVVVWLRYHDGAPDPKLLAPSDLANYYYPIADLVGRRLAAGELPLWDPASCSGIPLLATLQPAVLYPFTWLSAALPTDDALYWGLLAQVALAAAFTAAALRAGGAHWAAAGLGGVLYAHACLLGNLRWPTAVATMTWLPFAWLCVERLARAPRPGWWAALAVASALALLAGHPQYVVYGDYWLVPYAGVVLVESAPRGTRLRRGAWIALAIGLGAALAAAQLVPTAELAASSARGAGLTPDDVHYLDVGTRPARQVLANALDPRPKDPTFDLGAGTGYLGVGGVLCVVAMLWRRGRSLRTAYLVVAGALALSLSDGFRGVAAPLYALYHELPTGGLFRTPERLRFVAMICAIALACGGLDALLRSPGGRSQWRLFAALVVAAAGAALVGGPGVGWRALVALALAAAVLFGPRTWCGAAAALWVVFATIDLRLATEPAGVLHAYPRELSEQYHAAFRAARISESRLDEIRATTGTGRIEPYGFFPFHAAGSAYGLHRVACYEPLAPAAWRAISEVLMPDRALRGGLASPSPDARPVFYDVAAVATIVRPRRGVEIVVNDDALPRAYVVEDATRATQREAFEHVRDGTFDFHRGVLLEVPVPPHPPDPRVAVPARIAMYGAERVEIDALAARDAWLVLADTFYPGWTAEIDGEPATILRANGLYRAVRIAAGRHAVVFAYRPTSFRVGVAVSLASAVATVAIAFVWRRRTS